MKRYVSAIIPAYNEEKKIITTLKNLKFNWLKEIIVINDGSIDRTEKNIIDYIDNGNHRVRLYSFKENKGKGKAIEYGLEKAIGKIILLVDADLGESVVEAEKLILNLFYHKRDITIGILPIKGGGFGFLLKTANLLTHGKMKAPLSGQRALKRELLSKMCPLGRGYGLEIGMDLYILKNDLVYEEIECNFSHNITNRDIKGFIHRGKQLKDIIYTYLREIIRSGSSV